MKFKKSLTVATLVGSLVLSSYAISNTVATDAKLNAAVKSSIASDSALSGTTINSSVTNGVVSLSGNVASDTQASEATETAQSVPGVSDVDTSNLTVNGSQQPVSDTVITSKVKGMFIQQKLFGDKDVAAMSISVETNNGVVSLSGTADNAAQIANAVKIAKSVSGVKSVKTTVTVKSVE